MKDLLFPEHNRLLSSTALRTVAGKPVEREWPLNPNFLIKRTCESTFPEKRKAVVVLRNNRLCIVWEEGIGTGRLCT